MKYLPHHQQNQRGLISLSSLSILMPQTFKMLQFTRSHVFKQLFKDFYSSSNSLAIFKRRGVQKWSNSLTVAGDEENSRKTAPNPGLKTARFIGFPSIFLYKIDRIFTIFFSIQVRFLEVYLPMSVLAVLVFILIHINL